MFYIKCMELNIRYRGKTATTQDIELIKKIIAENPKISRRSLSKKLCHIWNWVQPNGTLRDMVCRGFLLQLESSGYIKLPEKKRNPNNPLANRKPPAKIEVEQTPVITGLSKIKPLKIRQVRRTPDEKFYNSLIHQFHYLGYTQPVGEHLKYIIYAGDRAVSCLGFSSAPRHIGSRDRFIGWESEIRRKNIHLIAYNTRFLILPWVRVSYLASHLLSKICKILPLDWQKVYNHPIYYLETFVDTDRFRGTCYKAANWIYLGKTTGRGKNDQTNKINRSIKAVWGYPLTRNFREVLQDG